MSSHLMQRETRVMGGRLNTREHCRVLALFECGVHITHSDIIEPSTVNEIVPFPRVANAAAPLVVDALHIIVTIKRSPPAPETAVTRAVTGKTVRSVTRAVTRTI